MGSFNARLVMKIFPFLPTLLAVGILGLALIPAGADESVKVDAETPLPLEKVAEQLARLDEEFAKRLEATAVAVEAEGAAKRIPEVNVQNLREILRTSGLPALERRMPLGINPSMVMENAALKEAWRELETTATQVRAKRGALFNDLARELRRRVSGAVLGRPKSEEIDALIQTLEKVQGSVQPKGAGNDPPIQWLNATNVLRALERLTDAESASAATALPSAVKMFRNATANYSRDLLSDDDAQTRISRVSEPLTPWKAATWRRGRNNCARPRVPRSK